MARYVPPIFPPIPPVSPANPLTLLTDEHLFTTQDLLRLSCGRSKTPLKNRNRQYVCFLQQLLKLEQVRRQQ